MNEAIAGSLPEYDQVYADVLSEMKSQTRQFIDHSSAMDMHVADDVWPEKVKEGFKQFSLGQTTRYPGLVTQKYFLEHEAADFFKQQFNLAIKPEEILVTNGSLTSPTMIMAGSPFSVIIHPDKCYQAQLSTFRAAGKQTVSCPTDVHGRLVIAELQKLVQKYNGKIAFIFLNHCQGATSTPAYLDRILDLAKTYDFYIVYDADTIATKHNPSARPLLALRPKYRDRFLVLTTFSKEFNCPAIRIGLAIGPPQLIYQVKVYQKHKLEILPTPSIEIARLLLKNVDVHQSGNLFQLRMKKLVKLLQVLGWQVKQPDIGINLFIEAPAAFQRTTVASPGTLFAYYIMKTCQIVVRPGINYGSQLAHTVRFVLAPTAAEIDEVFDRFKAADINYSMPMPEELERQFKEEATSFLV